MTKMVILIDDDQDDLDIMKEVIREFDDSIVAMCFIKPEDAIHSITDNLIVTPDFIFIDINMAPFTGDKCLMEFRKIPSLKNTIIAMFSTSIPRVLSKRLIEMGANFTFEKPNSFSDYQSILAIVFSKC